MKNKKQIIKDFDVLIGFDLQLEKEINKLFLFQEKRFENENNTKSFYKLEDIVSFLDTEDFCKVENYIKFNQQMEALARKYQEVGRAFEDYFSSRNLKIVEKFQEYKFFNPDWESKPKKYSEEELKKLYEIEEKFIDKVSPQWRVYNENGHTVHEEC